MAALPLVAGPAQAQAGTATVVGVAIASDAGDDGTYALGESIRVTLTFSETVTVAGAPRLKIDMDPAEWGEKWASYETGSGTTQLTFAHTVVEPNTSTQGIAVLADTLELNGGTIHSAASQTDADLTHTGLSHDADHKVDWQLTPNQASVAGVAITSDAGDDGTYALGETIRVTLTFSETVTVAGAPRLKIDMDPAEWGEKWASYEDGSRTTELTFSYIVAEPNISTHGIAVLEDSLELNNGEIRTLSSLFHAALSHPGLDHDASHTVDWQQSPQPPSVAGVAVSSDAGSDNTYALGETITVTVTFNEAVNVTGQPRLKIDMDPAEWGEKWASYESGTGTTDLTFTYAVTEPNISAQGIAVLADTLELNNGTVRSAASQTDADLAHTGLSHDADHKVDWQLAPNQAPLINTQASNHDLFAGRQHAPQGFWVSKPFHGIFSDPDGDELTYTASVTGGDRQLVETLSVTLDAELRRTRDLWQPVGTFDRVFFRAHPEENAAWKTVSPALPDPLITTVTLTATDPDGLSASVDGLFVTDWDSEPVLTSATARPEAIELTFDQALQGVPALDQFTVNVADSDRVEAAVAVSRVSVSGPVVTLEMASPLGPEQTVTVGYAHQADGSLQRAGGGDHVSSFTGHEVAVALPELSVSVCDRTPAVRDVIVARVGGNKECGDITANDLIQVRSISFGSAHQGVTSLNLRSGDFEGLRNLRNLNFGWHSVSNLPSDIFDGLSRLRRLDLSVPGGGHPGYIGKDYGLTALPAGVFDDLTSLESLDLSGNHRVHTLPEGIFDHLTNLQELNLALLGLSTLPAGVFDSLSNLENLSLEANARHWFSRGLGLTTLPEGIFDHLTKLENLDLHANSLTELDEDMFDTLSNLQALYLDGNLLTELPEDIFDGLSNLQRLNLDDNGLEALPEDVFDGLSNLENLDLGYQRVVDGVRYGEDSSLTTLPEDVFDGLSSLRRLVLADVGLTELPEDVFDGLSSLEDLDLSTNEFTELPEDVFQGLANLQYLELDSYTYRPGLTALPADIFHGLHNLIELNLKGNRMTTLPADVFDGLSNLYTLDLSENFFLTELPEGIFSGLTSLVNLEIDSTPVSPLLVVTEISNKSSIRTLDLSLPHGSYMEHRGRQVYRLTELPEDIFDGYTNLEILKLSNHSLTALPEDVFDGLNKLRELDLRDNELTDLPEDVFDGLTSLEELDLDQNDLTELHQDLFDGLTSLEKLDLGSSNLAELHEDLFDGLVSMYSLTITYTELTELPENIFDDLHLLNSLDLHGNQLAALPEDIFDGLYRLSSLNLGSNSLTELPENIFDDPTGLGRLNLKENRLAELPEDIFDGLTWLGDLELRGNQLAELPADVFADLINLRDLDLRDNQLASVSAEMFNSLPGLQFMWLAGNPGHPFGLNLREGIHLFAW